MNPNQTDGPPEIKTPTDIGVVWRNYLVLEKRVAQLEQKIAEHEARFVHVANVEDLDRIEGKINKEMNQ